jgi:DNA primase
VIPDEEVERVRDSADIVQLVRLRRVGNSYRGPCPFHGGTGPNFSVVPGKGFKCFVCGEGGDVFTFIQKQLGMDWPSAVRLVADRAGIALREVDTRKQEGPDPREPLWEANAAAAEFYRRTLWDDPAGAPAREYLASRDVSRELAERVGLGYAPRETEAFLKHFETLGIGHARLLEAGLMVTRDDTPPRPRFRGRLMFPILDSSGRHVGFGGRLLGPGEPKYLNSPESPVFSKGRLLYGHSWARNAIRKADRVLLVEGYFDALRLLSVDLQECVAPLGTALTEAQADLLVKHTKNVILLYDSDKAGLKATFRAGDELLRHNAGRRRSRHVRQEARP